MSAHLYRGAAGAETFAVIVYSALGLVCLVAATLCWLSAWFPLYVVGALACGRMAGTHWRERCELIETAKQIEESDLK